MFLSSTELHATSTTSPCFGSDMQAKADQRNMMRDMRNMRPQANAPIQRRSEQQSQASRDQFRSQSEALMAPYLARANQIMGMGRGCADVECAGAVLTAASSFQADVVNNLVPQMQQLAQSAQAEMINSTKMSLDRMEQVYQKNTGQSLPSSRSSYFPPLCRSFSNMERSTMSVQWDKMTKGESSSLRFANIREWNQQNARGLGAWVCVGSLAMGSVRCFEKQEDPKGQGRICEKIGSQVAGCYDAISAWTPMQSSGATRDDSNWSSSFDQPPPLLRVMTGGMVIEEKNTEAVFKSKEKEIKEMQLVAPLLREPEAKTPRSSMKEPPAPLWASLEEKLRSLKGLSPDDIAKMSEADWARYRETQEEILKEGAKSGSRRVLEAGANAATGAAVEALATAATWTKDNEEHIQSTVEMMETMAFIAGPLAPEVVGGIEAVAKGVTVVSRLLVLKADDRPAAEYAKDLVILLGPDQISKLQDKVLKKSVEFGGFSSAQADSIVEEAKTFSTLIDKASGG